MVKYLCKYFYIINVITLIKQNVTIIMEGG